MKKALLLSISLSLNITFASSSETEIIPHQESQATLEETINWIKTQARQPKGWDISSGVIHLYGNEPVPGARYCMDPWPFTLLHLKEIERYLPILNPHTVIYEKAYYKSGVPAFLINWVLATNSRILDLPVDGIYDFTESKEHFLGAEDLNAIIKNHPNKANIIWSERLETSDDAS